LAQRSPHREQQQHDREQQQKDQEWRRFLLSGNDYDREDIIISIDDLSAMSSSPSSSSPIYASINTHHNQENATMTKKKQQEEEEKKKDRKVRVVSFRLSERDYERHLSMAKICHENGLTKGSDIVSYIRLSMECLSRYITSQAEAELSAEKKGEQQQQLQIKKEGSVEQQDLNNYHAMTASSSSRLAAAAITTNTPAIGEQHTGESIARTPPSPPTPTLFNLHDCSLTINSSGKFQNTGTTWVFGELRTKTGGTLNNPNTGRIDIQCGGKFVRETGSIFTGNPVVDACH
jgi:hypothetical protein